MTNMEAIEGILYREFDGLEANSFAVLGRPDEPIWDRPLIGVAAGDDPYFGFMKRHVGDFYWSPAEVFAQKYGEAPDPQELSVISMVFPQTEATKEMQNRATVFPSDNWVVSRGEWEPLIRTFATRVMQSMEAAGFRCASPDLTKGMGFMHSDNVGLCSPWSHRHTAYAAGLGTFGLSDGFISERGIAIRLTSFVVEARLPAKGKVSEDPYGWCTMCGACIVRCPADAITKETGHDKAVCMGYEEACEHMWPEHIERGDYVFGCGLCQAKVPCRDHRP